VWASANPTEQTFIYRDHYVEFGTRKNVDLYVTRDEQLALLSAAGFGHINRLYKQDGMALYSAFKN